MDPSEWQNYALYYARLNKHTEIEQELLKDKRVFDSSVLFSTSLRKQNANRHMSLEIDKLTVNQMFSSNEQPKVLRSPASRQSMIMS